MHAEDPRVNELFGGKYIVRSLVGRGGMGVVYKVDHAILRRPLAVKVLRIDSGLGPDAVARFEQEAQAASQLRHTNLVHVTDYGVTKTGAPYLVMDYFDGCSIADMILQYGSFPIDQALPIFIQICTGVAYVHSKGIIHRDIKPSNIMLTHDEQNHPVAKILDFGLAKFMPEVNSGNIHLTKTGEVFGSPLYMSPEQCRGEPVDERSDLYSLACVMYEMLTGIPPFKADTAVLVIYKHVNEHPIPPAQVNPQIPEALSRIVMRALSKDLEIRYASVDALKDDLTRVAAGQEPDEPPIPEAVIQAEEKAKFKRSVTIGASVLVLIGILVAALLLYKPPPPPWQGTIDQAREQIQRGDLPMALLSYKSALNQAASGKPHEKAKVEIALADLYKRMGGDKNKEYTNNALSSYTEALPLIDPDDHINIAHTNEGLADCLHALKKYDEAEIYFANALDYRNKNSADDPYALAAVLMKQGRNFKDNNKLDQAESALRQAVGVAQKLNFVQQAYVPQCLTGLSQLASRRGQAERARLYKKAAEVQKSISSADDPQLNKLLEKRNKLIEQAGSASR